MQPGSVSGFTRASGALAIVAAAALATACGGGGGTSESVPPGDPAADEGDRSPGEVQIHVPKGWYLGDLAATGAVPPGPEPSLFLAAESVVPEDNTDAAPAEPASRDE